MVTSTFSFVVTIIFLWFNGYSFVDNKVREITDNFLLLPMIFFGVLFIFNDVISIPFSLYNTFVIEEKFGFNKTTLFTFITDKIKGYLLLVVIGGPVCVLIILFYTYVGKNFWIYCTALSGGLMIFFTIFYSTLIVPLFNKQTRLDDGELRDKIENFATKCNFKLDDIFKIDGSKRSTKANAYFSGLGRKKRIVLFDTLINELTSEEVTAVLAHEVGHYKKKHIIMNIIVSILQIGVFFYSLSLCVNYEVLAKAIGCNFHSFHVSLQVFTVLWSPIDTFMSIVLFFLIRKMEYQADNYATEKDVGIHLIGGLKKLAKLNLANLTPHWLYVVFKYHHPPLLERIKTIKENIEKKN